MSGHVWRQIRALMADATRRVILVAPYIKVDVFRELLEAIPTGVSEVEVITRWLVADVAAGVTDPEVLAEAQLRSGVNVLLHQRLHAKLYGADDRCLIGSANLTARAVGLASSGTNVEILLETSLDEPEVVRVLHTLRTEATVATADLAHRIREQATAIAESGQVSVWATDESEEWGAQWYPTTSDPRRLYQVYSGDHSCPPTIRDAALLDIAAMGIPPGLERPAFAEAVCDRLYTLTPVRSLTPSGRLSTPELEAAIIADGAVSEDDAIEIAHIIVRWLAEYDPHLQVIPRTFDLFRGRRID